MLCPLCYIVWNLYSTVLEEQRSVMLCMHTCRSSCMFRFKMRWSAVFHLMLPSAHIHTHTHTDCEREGNPVYPSWTSWPGALWSLPGHRGRRGKEGYEDWRDHRPSWGGGGEYKTRPSLPLSFSPTTLWPAAGRRTGHVWSTTWLQRDISSDISLTFDFVHCTHAMICCTTIQHGVLVQFSLFLLKNKNDITMKMILTAERYEQTLYLINI